MASWLVARWFLGGELVGGEIPWWRDDRIPSQATLHANLKIVNQRNCNNNMIQQTKRKQKKKTKQLKIKDFRHAGNENKQSRQDQPFSHQNALG